MNPGAMVRVINLMTGPICYNFTWTYLGFSGGSVVYESLNYFLPDAITHIYKLEPN